MRLVKTCFWLGTSLCFLGAYLSGNAQWYGLLIGYWFGFLNAVWLYRDIIRSTGSDPARAIRRMRRSFFARLGFVTMIVALIARFRQDWLLYLAVGIAVGVVLSLILLSIHFIRVKGGIHEDA